MWTWSSGKEDTKEVMHIIALVTVEIRVEVVQRCYMTISIISSWNVVWRNRKDHMAICVVTRIPRASGEPPSPPGVPRYTLLV